ncbi:hypothetical protein D0T50_06245 [Bacteroides sp. 214]|uniref:hypothetical protein n=1 Tax=Bacteroides sp. 214 TaxID=2302935 RepID=UPI0013D5CED7|nr:hypothetical protein [Bacteroides sp. 214]NDW12490.1 hypothetical protein [Bacteroides sp. 214]
MEHIKLSFSFKDSRFSLCATLKGTSTRCYKEVQGLTNPNWSSWEKKLQCFNEPTEQAIQNNNVLQLMKEHYQRLIDTCKPTTPKELFSDSLNETAAKVEAKCTERVLTFGEYLNVLIEELKNSKDGLPSTNYRLYITLLNKLKSEGSIINVPIASISDEHFEAFGSYINDKLNGVNYVPLMKRFKTTTRYYNETLKKDMPRIKLTYPYMRSIKGSFQAHERAKQKKLCAALSMKEYQRFVDLDLSLIAWAGSNSTYYKELYRDFCIFMYEMMIRPCDVVVLKKKDIVIDNGERCILYIPIKKKNYKGDKLENAVVNVPITKTAQSIINKYAGKSTKGYIFPFAINQRDWQMDDVDSFNKWYLRKQRLIEKIDNFLSKVQDVIKPQEIDKLTTYVFRRSTFTHKVNAKGTNIIELAKHGGTSVKMLEKHYYNANKK